MPQRAKATRKTTWHERVLTRRGEAETGRQRTPTLAKKPLLKSHVSLKSTLLFTPNGEIYSFCIRKGMQNIKKFFKKKKPTKKTLPLSQVINHPEDLFGGVKLSEAAAGTIYHLSSCIFWQLQEWSGMLRYITWGCSEGCLHFSRARPSLKQRGADPRGSSQGKLGWVGADASTLNLGTQHPSPPASNNQSPHSTAAATTNKL